MACVIDREREAAEHLLNVKFGMDKRIGAETHRYTRDWVPVHVPAWDGNLGAVWFLSPVRAHHQKEKPRSVERQPLQAQTFALPQPALKPIGLVPKSEDASLRMSNPAQCIPQLIQPMTPFSAEQIPKQSAPRRLDGDRVRKSPIGVDCDQIVKADLQDTQQAEQATLLSPDTFMRTVGNPIRPIPCLAVYLSQPVNTVQPAKPAWQIPLQIRAEVFRQRIDDETDRLIRYWANGQIYALGFEKNGVLHGKFQRFFPDGTLHIECNWMNGTAEGDYVEYYPNGRTKTQCTLSGGKFFGVFRQFNEHGRMTARYFRRGDSEDLWFWHKDMRVPVMSETKEVFSQSLIYRDSDKKEKRVRFVM